MYLFDLFSTISLLCCLIFNRCYCFIFIKVDSVCSSKIQQKLATVYYFFFRLFIEFLTHSTLVSTNHYSALLLQSKSSKIFNYNNNNNQSLHKSRHLWLTFCIISVTINEIYINGYNLAIKKSLTTFMPMYVLLNKI